MAAFKQFLMRAYRVSDTSYYSWVASEYDTDMSEGSPPHPVGDYSDFKVVGRVPVDYAGQVLVEEDDEVVWDVSDGVVATLTLTDDWMLLNPENMEPNRTYLLFVKQDVTGGHTLDFDTAYQWPGGDPPVLSVGSEAVDVITFLSDGTTMYGVFAQKFS